MTTQNPSGSFGPDDTADLVRSVALSSARLWEEVLERLARVEHAQVELAQALSRLQAELPAGPTMMPPAPGTSMPLAAPFGPAELGEPSAPHFVAPPPPPQGFGAAPPPPPPPGFGSVGSEAPGSTNGAEPRPEDLLADVRARGEDPVLEPLPAWTDAPEPPLPFASVPPPPPPPGFATGEVPAVGGFDMPPPPAAGFAAGATPAATADTEPPPPPPGFGAGLVPGTAPPAPPGFSVEDLTGAGAIGAPSPTPPPGFAPGQAPGTTPPPPPPSAPPGFSVADLAGGDAIGTGPSPLPPPPPPPPGFASSADAAPGTAAAPGYGSDPFGDLLGDLDSVSPAVPEAPSAAAMPEAAPPAPPAPTPPSGAVPPPPPPPPPGFSSSGGGGAGSSFADLPIVTPEPAESSHPEEAQVGGASRPVPGREGGTPGPRTEPPITPDFFARAGRRRR